MTATITALIILSMNVAIVVCPTTEKAAISEDAYEQQSAKKSVDHPYYHQIIYPYVSASTAFSSALILRMVLGTVAFLANSVVIVMVWSDPRLQTQPNILLANLAAADALMAVGFLLFSVFSVATDMQPTRKQCLGMYFPILWATYVSMCSVVPLAHYRIKLIKAYSRSTGSSDITQAWMLWSSIFTLWFCSLFGALLVFVEMTDAELERCIFPLAASKKYLVQHFLFTSTVTLMVEQEYVRLILFVVYGAVLVKNPRAGVTDKWHRYVKFDPKVTRVVVFMAGSFAAAWLPVQLAIIYYIWPYGAPPNIKAHFFTDLVQILPLVQSTINPFLYTLFEGEFADSILHMVRGRWQGIRRRAAVLRACCCPWSRRYGSDYSSSSMHGDGFRSPPMMRSATNDQSRGKTVLRRKTWTPTRHADNVYSISKDVVSMVDFRTHRTMENPVVAATPVTADDFWRRRSFHSRKVVENTKDGNRKPISRGKSIDESGRRNVSSVQSLSRWPRITDDRTKTTDISQRSAVENPAFIGLADEVAETNC